MVIKRVNPTSFDVFWNNGWEYWARFSRQADGSLKHLAGRQMPTQLFQQFRTIINKKGKGRQVQAATQMQNTAAITTATHAVSSLVGRMHS